MGRKSVPESVKWQIIGLFKAKKNLSQISRTLKVTRCCARNTISAYQNRNTVKTQSGAGRPRVTSTRTDRIIIQKAKKDRSVTANRIKTQLNQELKIKVSRETVNRRLLENNLKSAVATRKPPA